MTWRWLCVVVLISGCSDDPRHVAGAVVWVAGDAYDRIVHGAEYRAEFNARYPDCLPATVSGADGNGSGTCTTMHGCCLEATCFLDCDVRETCP